MAIENSFFSKDQVAGKLGIFNQLKLADMLISGISTNSEDTGSDSLATSFALYQGLSAIKEIVNNFMSDLNVEKDNALLSNPIIEPYFTAEDSNWVTDSFVFNTTSKAVFTSTTSGQSAYLRIIPEFFLSTGKYLVCIMIESMTVNNIVVNVAGNETMNINNIGYYTNIVEITDVVNDKLEIIANSVYPGESITISAVYVQHIHDRLEQYMNWKFNNSDFTTDASTKTYVDTRDTEIYNALIQLINTNTISIQTNSDSIANKANTIHYHTMSQIDGLNDALTTLSNSIFRETIIRTAIQDQVIFDIGTAVDVTAPDIAVFHGAAYQNQNAYVFCDATGTEITEGSASYIKLSTAASVGDEITILHVTLTAVTDITAIKNQALQAASEVQALLLEDGIMVGSNNLSELTDVAAARNVLDTPGKSQENVFSKAQSYAVNALEIETGGIVNWDMQSKPMATLIASEAIAIVNLNNAVSGTNYILEVIQNGTYDIVSWVSELTLYAPEDCVLSLTQVAGARDLFMFTRINNDLIVLPSANILPVS